MKNSEVDEANPMMRLFVNSYHDIVYAICPDLKKRTRRMPWRWEYCPGIYKLLSEYPSLVNYVDTSASYNLMKHIRSIQNER